MTDNPNKPNNPNKGFIDLTTYGNLVYIPPPLNVIRVVSGVPALRQNLSQGGLSQTKTMVISLVLV